MNRSRQPGLVMPASVGIPSHSSFRPPNSSFRRRPESRVGVWVANDPQTPAPVSTPVFIPWRAGTSDWHESMSRTPIRDESFPPRPLVSSCRRPLESPRTRHAGPPIVIPAKAGIQRGGVAPITRKHFQRPGLIFIPRCAGTSRHNLAYTAFRPTKMPTLDTKLTPVGFYPTEMSGYYPTAKNRPVRYYLVW